MMPSNQKRSPGMFRSLQERWDVMHRLKMLLLLASLPIYFSYASKQSALQLTYPEDTWQHASKSEVSREWRVSELKDAQQFSETIDTAAVVVISGGKIVSSWGEVNKKFKNHSIRKSLLSALIGIYVDRGTIDLDMTLEELKIDDIQSLTTTEKTATIKDLLKGRSGVYHPAAYETPRNEEARPKRHAHQPDEFWYYNNWDFNALGTIYEQLTEEQIFSSFKKLIAEPLGMEHF